MQIATTLEFFVDLKNNTKKLKIITVLVWGDRICKNLIGEQVHSYSGTFKLLFCFKFFRSFIYYEHILNFFHKTDKVKWMFFI